jgi:hypothetical protein
MAADDKGLILKGVTRKPAGESIVLFAYAVMT